MAWLVTDDGLTSDPRILDAIAQGSAEVAWLYQCLNVHAARHLTNGFIPATSIRLIPTPGVTQLVTGMEILVRVGLLRAVANGWRITDYLERNKAANKIKEKRAKNRQRQQEYRDRQHNAVTDAVTHAVTNGAPIRSSPILSGEPKTTSPHTPPDGGQVREWLSVFNAEAKTNYLPTASARRQIQRRIQEGYTLTDARDAVLYAARAFPGTPRADFLRPETIFGIHFANYVENQRRPKPKSTFGPGHLGFFKP
jgi:uncharacterized phage protein (TIGR02220 family)